MMMLFDTAYLIETHAIQRGFVLSFTFNPRGVEYLILNTQLSSQIAYTVCFPTVT